MGDQKEFASLLARSKKGRPQKPAFSADLQHRSALEAAP